MPVLIHSSLTLFSHIPVVIIILLFFHSILDFLTTLPLFITITVSLTIDHVSLYPVSYLFFLIFFNWSHIYFYFYYFFSFFYFYPPIYIFTSVLLLFPSSFNLILTSPYYLFFPLHFTLLYLFILRLFNYIYNFPNFLNLLWTSSNYLLFLISL